MQLPVTEGIRVALALQAETFLADAAGGIDGEDQQEINLLGGLGGRGEKPERGQAQQGPPRGAFQAPASSASRRISSARRLYSSAAS